MWFISFWIPETQNSEITIFILLIFVRWDNLAKNSDLISGQSLIQLKCLTRNSNLQGYLMNEFHSTVLICCTMFSKDYLKYKFCSEQMFCLKNTMIIFIKHKCSCNTLFDTIIKGHLIWDYIFLPVIWDKNKKNIFHIHIGPTRNLGVTVIKNFLCSISGRNWILEWQNKIESSILPNSELQNVKYGKVMSINICL